MRLRPPSADSFSITVALLVGAVGAVLVPRLGVVPEGAGVVVVAALVTWTLLEQAPERIDRAVAARLYLPLGGGALLPIFGVMGGEALGYAVLPASLAVPSAGLALLGIVVVETGRRRRARVLRARETVHLHLSLTESPRRLFVLSVASSLFGAGVVRLVAGETVGLPLLVGVVAGTAVGVTLVDTQEVDLYVVDRGLVVVPRRRLGASVVPWRRVRAVAVVDGTLRIDRGLPWPARYECDLALVDDARDVVATLRSVRRSV
ncbi:hypothetical protein [Salinigranum marinum]|uniref:hypothetical protein n=1 Tax=Salinigranum marinum TaxID=1515595 RepID=UPI002989A529|nr:hypothetical protein [Salinigranum marinum]